MTIDRIVDAHVHVWSPDTAAYPLAPGFTVDDLWLPSFTPEDHFRLSRPVGRVRMNLVQMTWYGLDHSYILDLVASDPETYAATGIVPAVTDVSLGSPDRAMKALAAKGIRAFRVRGGSARPAPRGEVRWMDHEGYEMMFVAGAEENLALSFLMGPQDIPELDRMCGRFPETPVIVDHVGGVRVRDGQLARDDLAALCSLARHRKIMVKLGPVHALGNGESPFIDILEMVERIVDAFGPERCMWESDCGGPVQMKDPSGDYEASVSLIRDRADFLSSTDREQILAGTAYGFFFARRS
jgi:predicted TIM-barrel fold metal-dependent hydrolase